MKRVRVLANQRASFVIDCEVPGHDGRLDRFGAHDAEITSWSGAHAVTGARKTEVTATASQPEEKKRIKSWLLWKKMNTMYKMRMMLIE